MVCGLLYGGVQDLREGRGWSDRLHVSSVRLGVRWALVVCGCWLLYVVVQDLCEERGWSDWLLYVGCSKTWGGIWLVLLTEPLS